MDIDLSKVAIVVLAVMPGYLARRGSARVIPHTLRNKGATEEIAEFLIFSFLAHFTLAFLYGCFWLLAGLLLEHSALFFLHDWLLLPLSSLLTRLSGIPTGYLVVYLFLSLGVGWMLGLGRGLLDAWRAYEYAAQKLDFFQSSLGRFWSKHIGKYLITDRPIIYDALFPDLDDKGKRKDVFVELVLKEGQGSITGRVTSFSIANDEESHKLILLANVYRKMPGNDQYEKLDTDGLLVDIADAITLQIKQV